MEIIKREYRLTDMHLVTFHVDDNSSEGDALMLEEAAQWFRDNPDYTLIAVAFRFNIEPTQASLELYVEG